MPTPTKYQFIILGATGPTGAMITPRLLGMGHSVTAVMRSGARADEYKALGASVAVADAMDRAGIAAALSNLASPNAAIINMLGGNPFMEPETWPDHTGVVNVTDAAVSAGIGRYVLVTSVGTGPSWEFVPSDAYIRPILKLKSKAEIHLKATALDWTIIKPGGLGPPDFRIERGNPIITENHGIRGLIDREDLADVILRVVTAPLEQVNHRELYAVVDRIEMHAGEPALFDLPELA